jgi:acetate kinase
MIRLFVPDPPFAKWYDFHYSKDQTLELEAKGVSPLPEITSHDKPAAIGIVLPHGSTKVTETATLLTPELVSTLSEASVMMPEHNTTAQQLCRLTLSHYPDVPQYLLCDTAFYTSLPAAALNYAVPPNLRKVGIRRFGTQGIAHEWAWRSIQDKLKEGNKRVLSISFGPQTSITAIVDGKPVESTGGFSPVEGMVSLSACGDIDPTVPLHLCLSGMDLQSVNFVLSQQSGLKALAENPQLIFSDLFPAKSSKEVQFARETYCYNLKKYIGAFTSVMGGLDAIVLFGDQLNQGKELVRNILEDLSQLFGIKLSFPQKTETEMTTEDSKVKVFCFNTSLPGIMAEYLSQAIQKGSSYVK